MLLTCRQLLVLPHPENGINEKLITFNDYNNDIKFPVEREQHNAMPFLDTKVHCLNNNIMLDWHRIFYTLFTKAFNKNKNKLCKRNEK